jgi:hypothetical protein
VDSVQGQSGVIIVLGRGAFEAPVLNVETGKMYFFGPRFPIGFFFTLKFGREEGSSDLAVDRIRNVLDFGVRSIFERILEVGETLEGTRGHQVCMGKVNEFGDVG